MSSRSALLLLVIARSVPVYSVIPGSDGNSRRITATSCHAVDSCNVTASSP
jgi:hypothetical protein